MAAKTSLNVSLTPELEKFIQDRVASGRYQTASEVVREGLRMLEREEQNRAEALKVIRAKIKRGTEQADRGEVRDGEEFFEELLTSLRKKSRINQRWIAPYVSFSESKERCKSLVSFPGSGIFVTIWLMSNIDSGRFILI